MRNVVLAAAAALLLVGPGCGGDDANPQEEAVSDTYVAYIDAVKAGDAKAACALTTPAFQRQAGRSVAVGTRAGLRDATCEEAIEKGSIPQLQQVEPSLEQIEIDGQRASGVDPGEGPIGTQQVFLERSGGDWKIAATRFYVKPDSG